MTDVLLATCAAYPHGDDDDAGLVASLGSVGLRASWAVWDDPRVDWSAALVVLRSTWDYTGRRSLFLDWAATVPRLLNPAQVVCWNSDKTYLADLAQAGVATVPTWSAPPGHPLSLPPTGEFVLKPSVGAGSRGAGRFASGEHSAALTHAEELHNEGRTVLVQPYLSSVDDDGETALVYFDARFSHAIRKGAMLTGGTRHSVRSDALFVAENIGERAPSAAELAVGAQAVQALAQRFGSDVLYTRVDLVPGPHGPTVLEVEAVEPSLFFDFDPTAADRFAAAIRARA